MNKKSLLVLQTILFLFLAVSCFRKETSETYTIDTEKSLSSKETSQSVEKQSQPANSEQTLFQNVTTVALESISSLYGGTKTANSEWTGKYGFSETTYEYLIDLELEEANVDKESDEYAIYASAIKQAYPYSVLEQSFGGVGFYLEYKGDGYLWGGTNQGETPFDLIQISKDGEVSSVTSSTYYGRFSNSIFWVNFDGVEIPFTRI